ncbi:hypothetical protein TNCV_3327001 [Trichonephila clavipes]|nr:hypothetical protein TNCV_3327001 [Trichonephila clavipes]
MVSCGISCQICSNCWTRSSKLPGRCNRLLIIFHTCSIGDGFDDLSGQESVLQAVRQFIAERVGLGLALSCCKIWPGYCKVTVPKNLLGRASTYRCAVSVPLMTTKGVGIQKKWHPRPYFIVWCAIVKAGSARCAGHLQTRLRWSSEHRRKWDSSLNTIKVPNQHDSNLINSSTTVI